MVKSFTKLLTILAISTLASLVIAAPLVRAAGVVTTNSATNIAEKSATFNGSIQGTTHATSRGFEYGKTDSFGSTVSDPEYEFNSQIGTAKSADGQFNLPNTADTDSNNNVYVVDAYNNRIQKFDSNGNFLLKWGSKGSANGEFNNPRGIAIDASNNVYVVDTDNNRIQKFDSNGNFILKWGTNGSGDGDFSSPSEIDTDNSGNVYVVEGGYTDFVLNGSSGGGTNNHRIQKFDSNGGFITKWGSEGEGDGKFRSPQGLAVDSNGNIYVVDTYNHRIQKFDSNGNFLLKWGSNGSSDGEFNYPMGLAIDGSDNVYIADTSRSRIQKFDSSGNFLLKWGSNGIGDGEFNRPSGLAIDSDNNIYTVDSYAERVQKFDDSGVFLSNFSPVRSNNSQFNSPNDIASDSSGNFYVADSKNNRIQKFDSNGNYIAKWGTYGTGNGEFNNPTSIGIDSNGDIYVVDSFNSRIQKFDSNGNFLLKWGSNGSSDGQFVGPSSIAVSSNGSVYVVEGGYVSISENSGSAGGGNNRIQKFDSNGNFLLKWGSYGNSDGQIAYAQGIALDSSNNVYIADTSNNRIQKFDSDGNFLLKWGQQSGDDGEFRSPTGIAIDATDNIFVSDTANNRIQKFDSSGTFTTKFGTRGTGDGEFTYPRGISVNNSGNVYVADTGNNLVQKYSQVTVTNEAYHSDISGLFCNKDYYYRAFTVEGGTKIYGGTQTFKTNACTGADLKIGISLNQPGLVEGQSASYTFTYSNVGRGPTIPFGYWFFVPPANVELGNVSSVPGVADGGCSNDLCYLLTFDPNHPPDFEHGDFGTLNVGDSISYTLPFNVTGTVDDNTSIMKAMVLDYSLFLENPNAESDSSEIFQYMANGLSILDLLDLQFNNNTFYRGTNAGRSDDDGTSKEIEDAAPNNGDANGDNTPDSEQANVASFVDPVTGQYATLEVGSECSITAASTAAESANTTPDSNYNYPAGLMNFSLSCGTPGITTTVTQYYYGVATQGFVLRKYNPNTNTYTNIDNATITGVSVGNQSATKASYQVTDGSSLDTDGATDGNITDPTGLALADAGNPVSNTIGDILAKTGMGQHKALYILVALGLVGLGTVGVVGQRVYGLKKRKQ